ncbi:MAG: MBL fold metallo-hydrolase [Acidimicrobiia bacterium]|nr:MBL fold metallo-hydrolase [Acidimicrobiia bacterium]NNL28671.1 MBL fold metallo-hydrolase [Acidimicrobiia bacterium]
MLIDTAPLWIAATNTYVVASERGGFAVVIDCPPDPEGIGLLLRKHELIPIAALVTHAHIDHLGGAGSLARATGVDVHLHPDDAFLAMAPEQQLSLLFGAHMPDLDVNPPAAYVDLVDGARLSLAGLDIDVVHTPGHTPGHCCFLIDGVLFSGDQLFAGSIGRTDLPGGDFTALMASMEAKILTLDDDVDVLPGHGPPTTIANERASNPFLAQFRA